MILVRGTGASPGARAGVADVPHAATLPEFRAGGRRERGLSRPARPTARLEPSLRAAYPRPVRRFLVHVAGLALASAAIAGGPPSSHAAACSVRYAVLYLDLDGTALDRHHEVRPATTAALAHYRACGGRVGIATGRNLWLVRRHLAAIGPDLPLVLRNGAAIRTPDGSAALEPGTPAMGSPDKARAIARVVRDLGLTLADVAAFGNGDNDVAMLREVGFGVAMGNCEPAACAVAALVVGDRDSDAIAEVVERRLIVPAASPE